MLLVPPNTTVLVLLEMEYTSARAREFKAVASGNAYPMDSTFYQYISALGIGHPPAYVIRVANTYDLEPYFSAVTAPDVLPVSLIVRVVE